MKKITKLAFLAAIAGGGYCLYKKMCKPAEQTEATEATEAAEDLTTEDVFVDECSDCCEAAEDAKSKRDAKIDSFAEKAGKFAKLAADKSIEVAKLAKEKACEITEEIKQKTAKCECDCDATEECSCEEACTCEDECCCDDSCVCEETSCEEPAAPCCCQTEENDPEQ